MRISKPGDLVCSSYGVGGDIERHISNTSNDVRAGIPWLEGILTSDLGV